MITFRIHLYINNTIIHINPIITFVSLLLQYLCPSYIKIRFHIIITFISVDIYHNCIQCILLKLRIYSKSTFVFFLY